MIHCYVTYNHSSIHLIIEYIQGIMALEEVVQHTVMALIQEVQSHV